MLDGAPGSPGPRAFHADEKDGMLIIPVAIVADGGGGGSGHNRRGNPAAGSGSPPEEGRGFGGLVLPSGAYVLQGDQVR
jgi:hypothetical protein